MSTGCVGTSVVGSFVKDELFNMSGVSMGTTITACRYRDGVVLVADSCTSHPLIVVDRAARKLTPMAERICVARCGSAADTENVVNIAKRYLRDHQVELSSASTMSQGLPLPSVKAAASLLRLITYNNKEMLSAKMIVAGYDDELGPQIYEISQGGTVLTSNFIMGGSGSTYIRGLADTRFKPDFSKEEATAFLTTLVAHAMARDGSSGGMMRIVCISKDQYEETSIRGDQLPYGPL